MSRGGALPFAGRDERWRHVIEALLVDRGLGSWRGLHPYVKWQGAFWRLLTVGELGVAGMDARVDGMLDAVLGWLVSDKRRGGLRRATIQGRVRWCATQVDLGLWAAAELGLAQDPRAHLLAESLMAWQWPDGGWNCDKRPQATHSSFHETHGPLRGLGAYHRATGDRSSRDAARGAARFLLAHRLYRSCRTGRVVHPELVKLHWPPYWHYDVLVGLRGLAAVDMLADPAAAEALDAIAKAQQPDGGWGPSGRRYWKRPGSEGSNVEVVDLSPIAHEVLTVQAAQCLAQAARTVAP